MDTSAAGDYEGIITVDSDGGTATVRVQARVAPDPRPATGAAATTRPHPVPEPPVRAQPGPQQDPALAGTSPAATAGAIPPIAETALAPVNPASGHAVAGPDSATPDRPQPQITPQPEFSSPTADGTSEEVVPADPTTAAPMDTMSGGAPGHHADMPSSALILTGPARSGLAADDGTGAASPPTVTAADQDAQAKVATAKAASHPTGIPGPLREPDRLTEEPDKPTADASRSTSAGTVLAADQSASSDPGSGDDGARPTWRLPPRLPVTALANAARRLRHRPVITSLVILLAVIIVGGYFIIQSTQGQYYLAGSNGQVVIYRGIPSPKKVLWITLSHVYQQTGIQLAQVPTNDQQTVTSASATGSLSHIQQSVANIRAAVDECRGQYSALQIWVIGENTYQAKVAQANRSHTSTKGLHNPGSRPSGAGPMCQPPQAFGIAPSTLTPSAAGRA